MSSAVRRRIRCARNAGLIRRRGSWPHAAGCGGLGEDGPQPRLVRRRTERQPRRIDPIELLAQSIGEARFLDLQFFDNPAQLAQVDDLRILGPDSSERARVRPQRIGDDARIAAVVLGAAGGEPVSKAIELLRVDREDAESLLQDCIDQRAARCLDADRDRVGRGTRDGAHPLQGLVHGGDRMRYGSLSTDLPTGIQHAEAMLLTPPIDSHIPSECLQPRSPFRPGRPVSCITLVRALEARLPTGCQSTVHLAGAHVSVRRSGRSARTALPTRWPSSHDTLSVTSPARLWKLPEPWTHRTRPPLLGKRTERVSHSYHKASSIAYP